LVKPPSCRRGPSDALCRQPVYGLLLQTQLKTALFKKNVCVRSVAIFSILLLFAVSLSFSLKEAAEQSHVRELGRRMPEIF
jgi:hypothetical protein